MAVPARWLQAQVASSHAPPPPAKQSVLADPPLPWPLSPFPPPASVSLPGVRMVFRSHQRQPQANLIKGQT
eukprot:1240756-Amphidinium_carterae.1